MADKLTPLNLTIVARKADKSSQFRPTYERKKLMFIFARFSFLPDGVRTLAHGHFRIADLNAQVGVHEMEANEWFFIEMNFV